MDRDENVYRPPDVYRNRKQQKKEFRTNFSRRVAENFRSIHDVDYTYAHE